MQFNYDEYFSSDEEPSGSDIEQEEQDENGLTWIGYQQNWILKAFRVTFTMFRPIALLVVGSWLINFDSTLTNVKSQEKSILGVSSNERITKIDLDDLHMKVVTFINSIGMIFVILGGMIFTSAIDHIMALLDLPNRASRFTFIRCHFYILMETIFK